MHSDQVRKRPKIGNSFEDFWEKAGDIPVEEGGLLASEDGPQYTDEMALKDARIIMQIEDAAEPGGILSMGRCSLFVPEPEEALPRQWAQQDHMVKSMANFRKLMLAEQLRHRAGAKRLAEACRDEWVRRQPKSAEQLQAEERDLWLGHYRTVAKALFGTWESVRAHVNHQRLIQWEAEEQRRVKAALNEVVNLSEQKLQARQMGADSEMPSDEDSMQDSAMDSALDGSGEGSDPDSEEDIDAANDDEDSDNMSLSEEEEGEEPKDLADEGLTQDQLREKYADIPNFKPNGTPVKRTKRRRALEEVETIEDQGQNGSESSDESVDMDDDMGSSENDSEEDSMSDEGADNEEEDEESEEEAGGLLGLFFGKSELNQLNEDQEGEETDPDTQEGQDEEETDQERRQLANGIDETTESSRLQTPKPESTKSEYIETTADSTALNTDDDGVDLVPVSPVNSSGAALVDQIDASDVATPDIEGAITGSAQDLQTDQSALVKVHSIIQDGSSTDDVPEEMDVDIPVEDAPTRVKDLAGDAVTSQEMTPRAEAPIIESVHSTEIPSLLRGTLREYQRHGLDWLSGLYANNTNGILADEMGLGKTIQTIALLAHLADHHEVWGPHLVIVPTSVMLNWEMEFKKWCPGFKILAYYGSQEERKRKRQGWNNDDVWNVCITSYQLVLQDQQVFKRRRWHYMILDEAHNIKNFKSQRWQTLLGFNTRARLLLTGTPLQNNLTELWSLLFFLMPAENGVGGFADLQEFHDWFQKPESQILESGREEMDEEAKAIIGKLHKVLRPYLLRRLKADVEKQMPGKYEHVEFCRLSKRQRELYDGFLARNDIKNTLASGNYLSIINCLMQLRKVCNHPDLFIDRPIVTSMRMQKSVVADFDYTERTIRRQLTASVMGSVNLGFLNLIPAQHEHISTAKADRIAHLSSHRILMDLKDAQKIRAQNAYTMLDPSTAGSTNLYLESAARWGRFEELQHCVYLNALRRQQRPIYGEGLRRAVYIGLDKRPHKPRPRVPRQVMAWFEEDSSFLRAVTPTIVERAESFKARIEKFSCVTPAVITRDMNQFVLGRAGVHAFNDEDLRLSKPVRWAPFLPKISPLDPWHEARMRLTIQFPDRRLLQYDCGKLQVLDKLLRRLQSGNHRALIFTQMTKVLDILEQFLNIHGHKYLRLDGATKVEQRQILTDRFNNDPRILCFILSTRSGGLGINLTGADTVIFYDQDWNPAMDKQCQDRCHRIGQTRDVHIYRLVSEHTIEANILRKASQKQMLDDVVIQEGEFTTDHFKKTSVRDVLSDKLDSSSEGVSAADAALDRVLGGPNTSSNSQKQVSRVFEQAEDREDVTAARAAEKEIQADDADFTGEASNNPSGASTARHGTPAVAAANNTASAGGLLEGADPAHAAAISIAEEQEQVEVEHNAWGAKMGNVDDYMVKLMTSQLQGVKLELPKDKKKGKKKGKDTRKR